MRVLVLSQYYDPEPIPKPSEVAEGLRRRGHEVTVITGLPNYPTGTLYPGHRLTPWARERVREIPVLRVFVVPYHGLSAIGRAVNYLSFMMAAILGGLTVRRPDVVYVFHPPLTVGVAAAVIGAFRRVPIVLDVQDIWPEAVIASGLMQDGYLTNVLRVLEGFVYRHARRVLMVTDGAQRNLLAKGVPQGKLVVLPNWISGEIAVVPSGEAVRQARVDLDPDGGAFIVTFAGNIGSLQDLDTVLDAAERLRSQQRRIAIRIIGEGAERKRLERTATSRGIANVRFLGPYPSDRMPAFFAASDALIVHLNAGVINELAVPTKTLAYMAAGRPIIAATGGATAELIDRSRAGLSTTGGDAEALAAAIIEMAALPETERAAMGERGRTVAFTEFDRERLLDRLAAVLAGA